MLDITKFINRYGWLSRINKEVIKLISNYDEGDNFIRECQRVIQILIALLTENVIKKFKVNKKTKKNIQVNKLTKFSHVIRKMIRNFKILTNLNENINRVMNPYLALLGYYYSATVMKSSLIKKFGAEKVADDVLKFLRLIFSDDLEYMFDIILCIGENKKLREESFGFHLYTKTIFNQESLSDSESDTNGHEILLKYLTCIRVFYENCLEKVEFEVERGKDHFVSSIKSLLEVEYTRSQRKHFYEFLQEKIPSLDIKIKNNAKGLNLNKVIKKIDYEMIIRICKRRILLNFENMDDLNLSNICFLEIPSLEIKPIRNLKKQVKNFMKPKVKKSEEKNEVEYFDNAIEDEEEEEDEDDGDNFQLIDEINKIINENSQKQQEKKGKDKKKRKDKTHKIRTIESDSENEGIEDEEFEKMEIEENEDQEKEMEIADEDKYELLGKELNAANIDDEEEDDVENEESEEEEEEKEIEKDSEDEDKKEFAFNIVEDKDEDKDSDSSECTVVNEDNDNDKSADINSDTTIINEEEKKKKKRSSLKSKKDKSPSPNKSKVEKVEAPASDDEDEEDDDDNASSDFEILMENCQKKDITRFNLYEDIFGTEKDEASPESGESEVPNYDEDDDEDEVTTNHKDDKTGESHLKTSVEIMKEEVEKEKQEKFKSIKGIKGKKDYLDELASQSPVVTSTQTQSPNPRKRSSASRNSNISNNSNSTHSVLDLDNLDNEIPAAKRTTRSGGSGRIIENFQNELYAPQTTVKTPPPKDDEINMKTPKSQSQKSDNLQETPKSAGKRGSTGVRRSLKVQNVVDSNNDNDSSKNIENKSNVVAKRTRNSLSSRTPSPSQSPKKEKKDKEEKEKIESQDQDGGDDSQFDSQYNTQSSSSQSSQSSNRSTRSQIKIAKVTLELIGPGKKGTAAASAVEDGDEKKTPTKKTSPAMKTSPKKRNVKETKAVTATPPRRSGRVSRITQKYNV